MKLLKKFVALALVLATVLSLAITAQAAYSTMYVTCPQGETVRLRKAPNSSATVLANVPGGSAVQAEYYNGTWCSVIYNGKKGYMMSTFLSSTEPTTAPDVFLSYAAQPFQEVTTA